MRSFAESRVRARTGFVTSCTIPQPTPSDRKSSTPRRSHELLSSASSHSQNPSAYTSSEHTLDTATLKRSPVPSNCCPALWPSSTFLEHEYCLHWERPSVRSQQLLVSLCQPSPRPRGSLRQRRKTGGQWLLEEGIGCCGVCLATATILGSSHSQATPTARDTEDGAAAKQRLAGKPAIITLRSLR